MNTDKLIHRAFNAFKKPTEAILPENEFKPSNTIRIARTVVPTNRTNFNDTMVHIHEQLKIN